MSTVWWRGRGDKSEKVFTHQRGYPYRPTKFGELNRDVYFRALLQPRADFPDGDLIECNDMKRSLVIATSGIVGDTERIIRDTFLDIVQMWFTSSYR